MNLFGVGIAAIVATQGGVELASIHVGGCCAPPRGSGESWVSLAMASSVAMLSWRASRSLNWCQSRVLSSGSAVGNMGASGDRCG